MMQRFTMSAITIIVLSILTGCGEPPPPPVKEVLPRCSKDTVHVQKY